MLSGLEAHLADDKRAILANRKCRKRQPRTRLLVVFCCFLRHRIFSRHFEVLNPQLTLSRLSETEKAASVS
jgi:hypothetical protein